MCSKEAISKTDKPNSPNSQACRPTSNNQRIGRQIAADRPKLLRLLFPGFATRASRRHRHATVPPALQDLGVRGVFGSVGEGAGASFTTIVRSGGCSVSQVFKTPEVLAGWFGCPPRLDGARVNPLKESVGDTILFRLGGDWRHKAKNTGLS